MSGRKCLGMGDVRALLYRMATSRCGRIEAQIKTAPGARCVNNEQCSQGLADWIGVD